MIATLERIEKALENAAETQFNEDVRCLVHGIKATEASNRALWELKTKEVEVLEKKTKELEDLLDHYRTIVKIRKED